MTGNQGVALGCVALVMVAGLGSCVACLSMAGSMAESQRKIDAVVPRDRGLSLFSTQGQVQILVAEPDLAADRQRLFDSLSRRCDRRGPDWCKFLVWDSPKKAPRGLPMSEQALAAMIADYSRNRATGLDRMLVCVAGSCNEYPTAEP